MLGLDPLDRRAKLIGADRHEQDIRCESLEAARHLVNEYREEAAPEAAPTEEPQPNEAQPGEAQPEEATG